MKRPADQWRLRDHVAFFSYRWLAWVLAALTLTLPSEAGGTLPRDAGLLLLLGVITVTATALAQSYVRLLRQRPALLALDIAACAAILWLSGSDPLPFFPYALGALILPAMAFGWRGAVLSALAFSVLDGFGLTVINPEAGAALSPVALVARMLIPLAFACVWALAARLLFRDAERRLKGRDGLPLVEPPAQSRRPTMIAPPSRPVGPLRPDGPPSAAPSGLAATTPLLIARGAPAAHPERPRRVAYAAPPSPAVSLPVALEQLAADAGRQSGIAVVAACLGEIRPLNPAQQTLLLRTAQEGLRNVQQHARARVATVTLRFGPGTVALSVEDDGVGLLDGTYERPGLHALRALRYRVSELEGRLDVFEREGHGLTLRTTLPLE